MKNLGQGLVEYVLLISLLAMVVVGGAVLTGKSTSDVYENISDEFGGEVTTPVATPLPHSVQVSVAKDSGEVIPDTDVEAFGENEELVGFAATDSTGVATITDLQEARYVFRVSYAGQEYWSETITVPEQTATTITITEQQFNVHVMNAQGAALNDVPVFVFNESGGYIGKKGTTDQNGMVAFQLTDGTYKFRADYHAQAAWSDVVVVPELSSVDIRVPIAPFTVRVYKRDGSAVKDVQVYAFNESGSYSGISARTGNDGAATMELVNGKYQFRVDYDGEAYWSKIITTPDTNETTVQVGNVNVTVRVSDSNGNPLSKKKVYVYDEDGKYIKKGQETENNGTVTFELPGGKYRFRVAENSQDYWSEEITVPQTTSAAITVTDDSLVVQVVDKKNEPLDRVAVYIYRSSHKENEYTGIVKYTDENGQVSFELSKGDYRILAYDIANDRYEWSNTIEVPTSKTVTLRIDKGKKEND